MTGFDSTEDQWNGPARIVGEFYIGCDPAKKRDYFVICVVQKIDGKFYLVKKMQFPRGTEYGTVLVWLKKICDKHDRVVRIVIDQTGLGDVIVELAKKAGLKQVRGVVLTMQEKQQVMVFFKEQMQAGKIGIPYDPELINQMNLQQYEVTETGQTKFSHPSGTHDDQLWAFALAVWAGKPEKFVYHPVAMTAKRPGSVAPNIPRKALIPGAIVGPRSPLDNDNSTNGQILCMMCGRWRMPGTECTCGRRLPTPTGPPLGTVKCPPYMVSFYVGGR